MSVCVCVCVSYKNVHMPYKNMCAYVLHIVISTADVRTRAYVFHIGMPKGHVRNWLHIRGLEYKWFQSVRSDSHRNVQRSRKPKVT